MKRRGSLAAACLLLAGAWLGPLPELARESFTAHMGLHVLVLAVAAPLLALGLAGGRFDPVRYALGMFSPWLAVAVEFIVVWAWHLPRLHHAAREQASFLVIEQGSYLAAGLLVWLAACGGSVSQRRARTATGVVSLLLTSSHMALLGVLLALAPRPLYNHEGAGLLGLDRLGDQQLGGIVMLFFGGAIYLFGGLVLLAGLLRDSPHWRGGCHAPR